MLTLYEKARNAKMIQSVETANRNSRQLEPGPSAQEMNERFLYDRDVNLRRSDTGGLYVRG